MATADGTVLGTLQYIAPEQLEGREAGEPSDLLAFGAVLDANRAEGLRRREPVQGDRGGARSRSPTGRHSAAPDAPVSTHRSEVPGEVS
jgi:serine/threonine protein kinase